MKKLVICLVFLAWCSMKELVAQPSTVTDIDGNVYHMVTIGTQVWMVENLSNTRYNDGTAVPLVMDSLAWWNLNTPVYCWYNNDSSTYKNTYGALYNWYAVNTGKLAPKGWHIPKDSEWTILSTYLGGDRIAGGKMNETGVTHWTDPNDGATNSSGFTGLPGGYRHNFGTFLFAGDYGHWWSSTEDNAPYAWSRHLDYGTAKLYRDSIYSWSYALSVRCVRDEMASDVDNKNSQLPNDFSLSQNYPNPFNPSTNISFSIPARCFVSLKVFDFLGREVATILSEELTPGNYTRQWNAGELPSGAYTYRLQGGLFSDTKKLVLFR